MLQWRRRLCCFAKMTWNTKRSLFRTHLIGLVSLVFLFAMFLFFNHHDWLPGRAGFKENPMAYTIRGFRSTKSETNHSSLRNTWKDTVPQTLRPLTVTNSNNTDLSLQGVTGLENTLSANGSIYNEKGTGHPALYHFKYIINEPEKCQEKTPFLILLIAAEPGQVEARQAIRQTWGNESLTPGIQIVRIFLLGLSIKINGYLQRTILEESRQYHDIIQQEYLDTYYNLTIKTLMGMNWVASYCPHVPYVMKTDSDMFVNTEYLIHKLLKPELPPRLNYFTGYLMRGYAPNRNKDSKWYMPPDLYPSERYPVFCSGTGYVFSGDLAEKIFKVSLSIRRLHLEDVYVGICLAKLRIDPMPPPNEFVFNHWRVSYSSCKYSHLITSHQFQPSELIKYWNHLQQNKHNACANAAKEKAVCPLPPMVSHGDYICHPRPCERYNHGTVVEFYCDPGYTLTNDYKYITCQYGEWFPSYQVYCVKTEQTWPNTQETLLTTWKIVAFTATSVLLVLLLVILARMFQTKFKTHFLPRGNQEGSMGDPDFVVVDGVPVMLPSYDEAVSSGLNALAPGYSATTDQGHILQTEDQNPPAYPGPRITDTLPSEFETCDSRSGSSELLQSLYPSPACQAAVLPGSDRTDVSRSTAGEAASTSPRIDIADEIPLMEEDP